MSDSFPWPSLTPAATAQIRQILEKRESYVSPEAPRIDAQTLERITTAIPGFAYEYVQRPELPPELRYLSAGFEQITGRSPEAFLGAASRALELVHPQDRDRLERLQQGRGSMAPRITEHRLIGADGNERWMRAYASPAPRPDGSVVWSGLSIDVTQFKAVEDAKRGLEQKLSTLAEQFPGIFYEYRLHPDGRVEVPFVSSGADALLGISSEAIMRGEIDPNSAIHEDDLPRILESVQASAVSLAPWRQEYRVRDAQGETRWMQGLGFPRLEADGSTVWLSVAVDITAIRRAEAQRDLVESRLRAFFDSSSEAHILIESDYTISAFNSVADDLSVRFTGRRLYVGESMLEAIPTEPQRELFKENIARVRAGKVHRIERSLDGPVTGPLSLRIQYEPVRTQHGVEAVSLSILDVTSERAAEEEIRLAAAVVREMPLGIVLLDEQGRVVRWLGASNRVLGRSAEDALDRNFWTEIVGGEPPETESGVSERSIALPSSGAVQATLTYGRFSTAFRPRSASFVLIEDTSERRSLEQQARQAQKMDALGLMAGGVAHDYNNLLTAVLGHSSLVRDSIERGENERALTELGGIDAAVDRAAQLTSRLLAFARKEVVEPQTQPIAPLLLSLGELLPRVLGETIKLELSIEPELGAARIDANQLEQILLNLALNARDAMPNGGSIEIAGDNVKSPAGAELVRIRVRDTGTGIPEEIRERIFEPFFTTKAVGQGTGLGLSTCFGLVRQLGGRLELETEIGKGSTFEVLLPRQRRISSLPTDAKTTGSRTVGTASVLLVEDEDLLRTGVARGLRARGFRVFEAPSSLEGEVLLEPELRRIDVLVTDIVMPGKSGPELATTYRELYPDGRVIFISGYAGSADRQDLFGPDRRYLAKPFTPEQLAALIQELLGPSDARPSSSS